MTPMASADQGVDDLLARVGDRPPGDQLLQLDEGDGAARERDRPDEHARAAPRP